MIDYTREDVIEALEYLLSPVCTETQFDYCDEIRAAIVLLKEQEVRVMTLEELQAIGASWNRNTPPYLFVEERSAAGSRWMSWGFMRDFVRLWGTLNVKNYGSKWRVWNLQPTPEQMRETPWEVSDNG